MQRLGAVRQPSARLQQGDLKRIIFMATGALMSVTSSQQGETIPASPTLSCWSPPSYKKNREANPCRCFGCI